jgi:hypothetical protein
MIFLIHKVEEKNKYCTLVSLEMDFGTQTKEKKK